jgi:hypothetical protein
MNKRFADFMRESRSTCRYFIPSHPNGTERLYVRLRFLILMTLIWLYLLGWSRVLSGHFSPAEIALTLIIGELAASMRSRINLPLRRQYPSPEQGFPGSSRASSSRALAPVRGDAAVTP